jgi:hypothetical protein
VDITRQGIDGMLLPSIDTVPVVSQRRAFRWPVGDESKSLDTIVSLVLWPRAEQRANVNADAEGKVI